MKLNNDSKKQEETYFKFFSIIMIPFCFFCTALFLPLNIAFEFKFFLLTILYLFVIAIIILSYINIKDKNINKEYIKNIGEKASAYIVNTTQITRTLIHGSTFWAQLEPNKYSRIWMYCIDVKYNNQLIRIFDIEYNEAFSILKLLLNQYPVKKEISIPIDIYIYKNKVYADLNSVDLSVIDGFEEAKKAIN